MNRVTVARALTANIAQRVLRFSTIVVLIAFGLIVAGTWALAHFVSGWWWLLLIPFVILLGILMLVRLILRVIIGRIHAERLSKVQKKALDDFTDKVQSLLEARSTPLPLVVLICIKDLLFHRDITTIKQLIRDSVSLRADYEQLEKLFS